MVDRIIINNRKRKVKRLSGSSSSSNIINNSYYPSAFINKPCDQLFGPQPLDCSLNSQGSGRIRNCLDSSNQSINETTFEQQNCPFLNNSVNAENVEPPACLSELDQNSALQSEAERVCGTIEKFTYIPAPKWNKIQNSLLEELFRKSRYPKPSELKQFAQRLNVMDSDIEEWFRKRRGKDRKTRRKNEALKSLIDNYLDK